jgi:hypothetical protein
MKKIEEEEEAAAQRKKMEESDVFRSLVRLFAFSLAHLLDRSVIYSYDDEKSSRK